MSASYIRPARQLNLVLAILLGIGCAVLAQRPGRPQRPAPARGGQVPPAAIRLSPDQIPMPPGPLAVFRLSAQKPPTEFVQEALRRAVPDFKELAPLSQNRQLVEKAGTFPNEIVGAFSEGHLVAYVNLKTGDAEIFPSFTRQKPVRVTAGEENRQHRRAMELAREVSARADVIEKDATQVSLDQPRSLNGESVERGAAGNVARPSGPQHFLTYIPMRRSVGSYFVYGPGSRALVVVGNDGSVQGFVRRWKKAAPAGEVRETRSREQVAEAIRAQLLPASRESEVEVLGVEIAYYDAHLDFLQPVYRFTARIHHNLPAEMVTRPPAARVDDDFVVGYVPIGKAREPVPSLSAPHRPGPSAPQRITAPRITAPAIRRPEDPTVGRYVVRDDDSNWVADANEFWGGLTSWFGGALFTNSQYYWAYPFEFNTSEGSFVNSVNVALNEVHGNWWLFTTEKNCCDVVDITAIPATEGYGSSNGGQLCYWILHSCEVVPSAADAPCSSDSRAWWTPWFNVFRGLHTVVGYRTIMWIDDDVGGPYGMALRFGAPVVSAWFNATTSAAGYQGNPTYGAHCGNSPPMGRPSTVSYCGRENDWVYDTTQLPAANCLINYWQPN